jgi:ubiquinone/menaquinone biosynthesis C-methylase UbiE
VRPERSNDARLVFLDEPQSCCSDPWEDAYGRFETPEQEISKFRRRLLHLGAADWPRDAEVLELFSGRGNGLHALQGLGFSRIEGVDLSASLLGQYQGPSCCYVCDCRRLLFLDASKDIVIVQGGLHHLSTFPDDLDQTLGEIHRVLRDRGLVALIEPWMTPFLAIFHAVCRKRFLRKVWPKIDAYATMMEHERATLEAWLRGRAEIMDLIERRFEPVRRSTALGKLMFLGRKRAQV